MRCAVLPLLDVQPPLWLSEGFDAGKTMQYKDACCKASGVSGRGKPCGCSCSPPELVSSEFFTVVQEAL